MKPKKEKFSSLRSPVLVMKSSCCGATVRSEQQHNQDLREIYKVRRILEFIAFYHNALYLTRVLRATFYQNALRHEKL